LAAAACLLVCAWTDTSTSSILFEDVAAQSGIPAQIRCGGPGATWLDFDRDGRMVLQMSWTASAYGGPVAACKLWKMSQWTAI
jgi:hypothetical protein